MINPPKPLPADERTLVEAWHCPNSTAAIAADLGIKGGDLDLAFRRLKREGKLPKHSRQGARGAHSSEPTSDRPAADENGSAALLEALIKAHGDDNETGERRDIYPGLSVTPSRKARSW